MLSRETEKRLATARQNEDTYQPNASIRAQLASKTLVMFVGPVAVGKSYLMNHVAQIADDFSRVPVFTTRDPRADDEPGMFRYLPHDDAHVSMLLGKIENGEVVQYAIHPTSGRIYGSEISDHPNAYNMLAMLSGGVEQLRQMPFKGTVTLGVGVRPETWRQRLAKRYSRPGEEKTRRLREAALSLDWLLADPHAKMVDNTPSDPAAAIQAILRMVRHGQAGSQAAKQNITAMRAIIGEEL